MQYIMSIICGLTMLLFILVGTLVCLYGNSRPDW